jgi:hypothetical protein
VKKNGYRLILAPSDWPGPRLGVFCFEHQLVVWRETGLLPQRGYCIHHKNHVKTDNDPGNLERITVKEHFVRHKHRRWQKCPVCRKAFNAKAGQVCCSRACANKRRSKGFVNGHGANGKK